MTTNLADTPATWPVPRIGATVLTRVPGPVVYARIVAVLAAGLALVHVWVMVEFPHGPWVGAVLGAMVLLCLKCAHRAWGNPAALLELLAMSALMALAHTFMALGVHGHRHGGEGPVATAGSGAMLGIAAVELVLVMLCGIGVRLAANRSAAGTGR
ncbi:hypothetical protein [Paeniglutamicibacter psychrophenolicus]|uniref:hypothetical protein n=1 Tax=Paeniglutamicibacter psychrophenolicus TaxID=257454 RepID=UPI00278A851D|nr:hypothetical protein [Paeniglutamicibacter psychrophenolicus]MDQ0095177.1 ABC-type Na+ efflux pump permease subunit [Paeniglutamicibacter psychrophenolicus]